MVVRFFIRRAVHIHASEQVMDVLGLHIGDCCSLLELLLLLLMRVLYRRLLCIARIELFLLEEGHLGSAGVAARALVVRRRLVGDKCIADIEIFRL